MAKSPRIIVDAIIVPPGRDGIAFGHDARGRCVELTGTRAAMLELFDRLREAQLAHQPQRVRIDPTEWPGIKSIEPVHCPMHALPELPADEVA